VLIMSRQGGKQTAPGSLGTPFVPDR
jgi:hypothetical protein